MWLDIYKAPRDYELRVRDSLRKAKSRELLREIGKERRGWLPQPGCWLLCQLGHLLVALGERLERYGPPQSPVLEGHSGGTDS